MQAKRQALAQAQESEFSPFLVLVLVLVLVNVRFHLVYLTCAYVCAHACACVANENQVVRRL